MNLLRRYAPPPEVILHALANATPFAAPRMAIYRLFGVKMSAHGSGVIMRKTEVFKPGRLELGRGSVIGRHCLVDARGEIRIGDNVNVSSYTRFMTAKHVVEDPAFDAVYEPIVVEDRAWIAIGTTILGGVTIGEGAIVAAGAVVTRDVEPFTIVAGVPAQEIGRRRPDLGYEFDYRPNWL